MKKIVSGILCLLFCLALFPMRTGSADTYHVDEGTLDGGASWYVDLIATGKYRLTVYGSGAVTVPISNGDYEYPWSGNTYTSQIRSIKLDGQITALGKKAFNGLSGVESISVIPSSVRIVQRGVFWGMPKLHRLVFSGNAPQFEDSWFDFDNSSVTVHYPQGNTTWLTVKDAHQALVTEEKIRFSPWRVCTEIGSVSLFVTAPKAGQKPSYEPILQSGAAYYSADYSSGNFQNDVIWSDETAKRAMVPGVDTFIEGHAYEVMIWLTPFDGVTFTEDVTGTINGYEAQAVNRSDRNQAWFSFLFVPGYGWIKADGHWYYYTTDREMLTGWQKIQNVWYYFDSYGVMQTGWQQINGKWYHFTAGGAMQTGWQKISEKWYYFNSGGDMTVGWKQVNGKWYYFQSSGVMKTGWLQLSGKWYYLNSGGDMAVGWKQVNGKWYYFQSSGVMKTGWLQLSGKWYWLDSSGAMFANGSKTINGKVYRFDASGVCQNP